MLKKLSFGLVVTLVLAMWPLSLWLNPPKISWETIFYKDKTEELKFLEKLSLDTSFIKKFYYNKTTLIQDRYFKNVMVLTDLNNYFFQMHPREDVPNVDYRIKYFYLSIILLIFGIIDSIKNKQNKKVWLLLVAEILVVSFFRKIDGIDFIIYFPLSAIMIDGLKSINKLKGGGLINLILIMVGLFELVRMMI